MTVLIRIGRAIRFSARQDALRFKMGTDWRDDVIRRLDALAQTQTQLGKAAIVQLERMRPSRPAWVQAVIYLVLATAVVVAAATLAVRVSSLDEQAAALRAQAQTDSLQATAALAPLLGIMSRSGVQYLTSHASRAEILEIKSADASMRLSSQESAAADRIDASVTNSQIAAQISLAAGSAFLGAMLGWIVTQLLAELRWKHSNRSPSSS